MLASSAAPATICHVFFRLMPNRRASASVPLFCAELLSRWARALGQAAIRGFLHWPKMKGPASPFLPAYHAGASAREPRDHQVCPVEKQDEEVIAGPGPVTHSSTIPLAP